LCQIWEKGRLIEEFYSNDSLGNDFIKVTPLMDRVKGYNEDILNDYLSSGDTLRNLYTKSLKWFFLYHGMCVTEKQNDTLYYMDFNTQNVVPYSLLTDGNKTLESNRQGWHLTKVNSDSLSVTYYFSDSVVLQTKKQFPIKQGVNSYSFISLESTRKALGKQGFWGEEITAPVYGKRLKSNLTGKRFK